MSAARAGSGRALALLLAAAGCAEILGFEDSPDPSECVRDTDCATNETCREFVCVAEAAGGGSGAAGAAAVPDGGVCAPGQSSTCLECSAAGQWRSGNSCEAACQNDTCVIPPSCNGMLSNCGPSANCCNSLAVPGGSFSRGCDRDCMTFCEPPPDNRYPADISSFALDSFEVTVGRLRQFVNSYPATRPEPGVGKNPNDAEDRGWEAAWDQHLPANQQILRAELAAPVCEGGHTWTDQLGDNESKPVNCVTWYVAYAFCAWDGGRLPTQAEWNYVAAGGEARRFPWSVPPGSSVIDAEHAVYRSDETPLAPQDVGRLERGRGRWGHYDLAGNVLEWVRDSYMDCYVTPRECEDCADIHTATNLKVARGGSFVDNADDLEVRARSSAAASDQYAQLGFRCARDLTVNAR
jgi:formylglycine-generating enzyme